MKLNFFNIFTRYNSENEKFSTKCIYFLCTFLFNYILVFAFFIIIIITDLFIVHVFGFESVKNQFISFNKKIGNYEVYKVALIVPFLEEIFFRLSLIPSKITVKISLSFILFYIINTDFYSFDFYGYRLYLSILSVLFFIFFIKLEWLIDKMNNNRNFLVIFSICFFGLIHLTNIELKYWELALLYPIYILPQISLGYFISNLRLKFGFIWGLALHCLVNFLSVVIFL